MNADFEETTAVFVDPEDDALGEASGPGETTGEPEEGLEYSAALGMEPEEWMAKDIAPADLED